MAKQRTFTPTKFAKSKSAQSSSIDLSFARTPNGIDRLIDAIQSKVASFSPASRRSNSASKIHTMNVSTRQSTPTRREFPTYPGVGHQIRDRIPSAANGIDQLLKSKTNSGMTTRQAKQAIGVSRNMDFLRKSNISSLMENIQHAPTPSSARGSRASTPTPDIIKASSANISTESRSDASSRNHSQVSSPSRMSLHRVLGSQRAAQRSSSSITSNDDLAYQEENVAGGQANLKPNTSTNEADARIQSPDTATTTQSTNE